MDLIVKKDVIFSYFLILIPNLVMGILDSCFANFLEKEYK